MEFRTDLAIEQKESLADALPSGVICDEHTKGEAKISRIKVVSEEGAQAISKPVGTYVTIEVPPLSDNANEIDERMEAVAEELRALLPTKGEILVAGLGNSDITPDALGPLATEKILATRHITGEIARAAGLGDLRQVSVLAPGVLGQTGIETSELILGIVERIRPAGVVVIDALASRRLSRLGCTVQLSDTGISPGAGVGNFRKEISEETLGVPVIAMGVPTVVDAATLVYDLAKDSGVEGVDFEGMRQAIEPRGAQMVVTPREIDLLVQRAAGLIALSINRALHPHIEPEDMLALVS